MVGLLHAMAFMVLLLIGWVIWNNKPLPFCIDLMTILVLHQAVPPHFTTKLHTSSVMDFQS